MTNRIWAFAAVLGVMGMGVVAVVLAADEILYEGRPKFAEGDDRAYYVWRDKDRWHVRWTTMGAMHRFTGSVFAEGDDLKSLKRIDVESERRVIAAGRPPHVVRGPRGRRHVAPGRPPVVATREQDKIEKEGDRTIRFSARTDDDIDGFDFEVADGVRTLRFVLEIDGASHARDVEVGRLNQHPRDNPFIVRIK